MQAFDMNDTDVFFMNKFGYVALKEEYIDLAHIIFERVIKRFHIGIQLNRKHIVHFIFFSKKIESRLNVGY